MARAMIGNAYISGGMSLLVVDKIRDTYIISLQKYKDGFYIQFPFIPIHQSLLADFIESAKPMGTFTPASIENSLEMWKEHESCYFTIPPAEIWDLAMCVLRDNGRELEDYRQDAYILFPPIFPGNPERLNGDEDIVHYCSEPIGKMFDRRNN
jgi:hypothetical protein